MRRRRGTSVPGPSSRSRDFPNTFGKADQTTVNAAARAGWSRTLTRLLFSPGRTPILMTGTRGTWHGRSIDAAPGSGGLHHRRGSPRG
ncbi:protein of unknown function [Magnetospirillum sp. XM-1]|nr:protein of unknown function [Magnetospirillum sp. XM-1]